MQFFRNLQNINSLIVIAGVTLCFVFIIQLKEIYNKNQRYNRYLGYKEYITEISMNVDAAERTADKSAAYIHQLSEAMIKNDKDIRNITLKFVAR